MAKAAPVSAPAPDRDPEIRDVRSWPPVESANVTKTLLMVGRRRGAPALPCPPGSTTIPFELLPVANRPVLFHTLDWLEAGGIRDVALLVDRRMMDQVREAVAAADEWSLALNWLPHDVEAGLGAAISIAQDVLDGDAFLLHLGDSVARAPLKELTREEPLGAADVTLLIDGGHASGPDGIVDLARGRLASLVGGLPVRSTGALAGVALFGAGAVEATQQLSAGSDDLEILSAAERLSASGGRVDARVLNGWWRFHGQPDSLLDANRFVLEGMPPGNVPASLHGSNIQGNVSVHASAMITSTTIRGPAIIGPNARLTDAFIGPYTSIGENVVVEGAEIDHSIIFPDARISYLGARLEASVIGTRARVFRDFKLPRALRVRVGEGAEVSLA